MRVLAGIAAKTTVARDRQHGTNIALSTSMFGGRDRLAYTLAAVRLNMHVFHHQH